MKTSLYFFSGFLFLLSTACTKSTENMTYDLSEADPVFVLLQLKENSKNQDSLLQHQEIRSLVDQIKAANAKLGYEPMEKKVASFDLEDNGRKTTYLAIRSFEDFKTAGLYARNIEDALDSKIFGDIDEPFPISLSDYRRCIEEKDFNSYYKYYRSTLSKG